MIVTRENYDNPFVRRNLRGRTLTFVEGKNLPVEEKERVQGILEVAFYNYSLKRMNEKLGDKAQLNVGQ